MDLENTLAIRRGSPWETFTKVYKCELTGAFFITNTRVRPSRLAALREVEAENIEKVLYLLKNIRHPNILSSRECFLDGNSLFYIHDDIPISLDNIVACDVYLNET